MKKVIKSAIDQQQILIDHLEGREIVVYRVNNEKLKNNVCILSHLGKNSFKSSYGFINLADPSRLPTYASESFHESIRKAIDQRRIFVFENQAELIKSIHLNDF